MTARWPVRLAGYQIRPTDRDRLQFTWQHRQSEFGVPNEIVQEAAGQRQDNSGRDDALHGAWTRVVGSRSVFSTRGLIQHLSAGLRSNEASTPVIVEQDRSFTRGYVNASLAADLGRHQLKFGGDLVVTPVSEALAYRITDDDFFEEGTSETFQFADERTSNEQSLYVQDTIRRGRLTFSAGLRWDRYDFVVHENAFSPRIGIAWAPADDVVLRASYDRVFQTPAVENLLLASSPDVDAGQPGVGAAAGGAVARTLFRSGLHIGDWRRRPTGHDRPTAARSSTLPTTTCSSIPASVSRWHSRPQTSPGSTPS